jgi:chemotaxis protein methyltransferase CheR
MTTNESLFFRDTKPFIHLRTKILPALMKKPAGPVRIWSAAASTGQEAYSIAMSASEPEFRGGPGIEIIGTDISREALSRARAGLYSQFEVQRGLPVQMLVKHFRKEETGWQVTPTLRQMASFREANLLGDLRGLGLFDVVFCRNVLIYFDPPTKARVLRAIAAQMPRGAVLYLGGAESALEVADCFTPVAGERCTSQRL